MAVRTAVPVIRGLVKERADQTLDQKWEVVLIDNIEGVDPPEPRPEDIWPDYRPR